MAAGAENIHESITHTREEPPPFLTSWNRVYVAVLCYLVFLIAALYAFTVQFRY